MCAGQVYLPQQKFCSLGFIRKMMCGEKKFFYTRDVCIVSVPRFASISVRSVLEKVWDRREIMVYLPDMNNINCKSIDREFLYNIVNTVDRQFFAREVERCEKIKAEK